MKLSPTCCLPRQAAATAGLERKSCAFDSCNSLGSCQPPPCGDHGRRYSHAGFWRVFLGVLLPLSVSCWPLRASVFLNFSRSPAPNEAVAGRAGAATVGGVATGRITLVIFVCSIVMMGD